MEDFMTVFEMIEAQQKGKEDTTIFMVGEQLKDICRADPTCAEIVAQDLAQKEMSIEACEKKIKAHADKLAKEKKHRSVGVSPAAAEKIIREFYGLPEAQTAPAAAPVPVPEPEPEDFGILDLDDLLG